MFRSPSATIIRVYNMLRHTYTACIVYKNQKFITAFTSRHERRLPETSESTPRSLRSILILSFRPCLGLSSGLFPPSFPNGINKHVNCSRGQRCMANVRAADHSGRLNTKQKLERKTNALCPFTCIM